MRKSILRNPQEANRARDYSPHAAQPATAPRFASARASYPVFLSLYDTLKLQIGWGWRGLVDAFRWDLVIGLMTRNVCFSSLFFGFCLSMSLLKCLLTVIVAIQRSARIRSSVSCSMASPCSQYMSLNSFCTLYREVKRVGREHVYSQRMGFIGVLGGYIIFCGCYQSSVCRSISMCVIFVSTLPRSTPVGVFCLHFFPFRFAGLVVLSYCQAHFYPATWTRVPLCWNDICHVAKRVHRIPQLACYVCVPCCHDRDVRLCLLCAGLCPRCRRCNRNHLLLLGRCVSERGSILLHL